MKILFFSFFFLLILGLAQRSLGAKSAYWGAVSSGHGNGVLGHGFLLIKEETDSFLEGDAYQYNITYEALKLKRVEFTPKKEKFFEILGEYTLGEDRSIRLYQLQLSQDEINKLTGLLENDLQNLNFSRDYPYGLTNNCVSRPIDLVNSVVDPSRRIEYWGNSSLVYSKRWGAKRLLTDPLLNRIPFYVEKTLENHPLSRGCVKQYSGRSLLEIRFLSGALRDLHRAVVACRWDAATEKSLSAYYALLLKSRESQELAPLRKLYGSCPQGQRDLAASLSALYEVLDEHHIETRKEIYKVVSELTR